MNRRDFLKSMGMVAAGTAITTIPQLVKDKSIPAINFDKARLQRRFNGDWVLDFESTERFDLRKKSGDQPNDLVVEIGEYVFLLKQVNQIDFASVEYTLNETKYLHQLVGNGWEQL